MHGLVLAGGEGSRLARGGIPLPKPLVEIAGRPQVLHLLETFAELGCASLTCVVRSDSSPVLSLLEAQRFRVPFRVLARRTPSSLHTLVEGLGAIPPGPVFCSMVDTVMRPGDWRAVYGATKRYLADGADAVLAVTPFVDDESPVYVGRQAGGFVRSVGDEPVDPPCVTGGVYGLGDAARGAAVEAVGRGLQQMRRFLEALATEARIATIEVPRIIDIDRPSDLATANAWLAARES